MHAPMHIKYKMHTVRCFLSDNWTHQHIFYFFFYKSN